MYKIGSLFAGIGGICKAFKEVGSDLVWANEFDKNACKTYKANFQHSLIEGDIHNIDPKGLEEVDIITSGFPCQAFSIAGYRKGFTDERGDLFFETMRFINEIKPKAFLLENVRNLVGHDNGNTFKVIKEFIEAGGYSIKHEILDSMEHGNVPQTRKRIYIVGFQDEGNMLEMDPKRICSNNFKFPEPIPLKKTINDLLEKDRVNEKYYYRYTSKYYNMFKGYINKTNTIYQLRRTYVRENKSSVCPTLTANMGMGGHNVPLILDDYGIRKLTPRECARFQGFPDDFILPENVANSHLYKQMGNSVVVPVVQRIAENLISALDAKYFNSKVAVNA